MCLLQQREKLGRGSERDAAARQVRTLARICHISSITSTTVPTTPTTATLTVTAKDIGGEYRRVVQLAARVAKARPPRVQRER